MMPDSNPPARKGARSVADVPDEIRFGLSNGTLETASLSEQFTVDFVMLMNTIAPDLSPERLASIHGASTRGIVKRMEFFGHVMREQFEHDKLTSFLNHPSDTVRGWLCYAIGHDSTRTIKQKLTAIKPLADDPHFGVREWAWLALRGAISEDVTLTAQLLLPWARSKKVNLRRYAIEIMRCRGVWTFHIQQLKEQPEIGLPLLEANNADPSKYIQDSVTNYLNDAAKSQPEWVHEVTSRWLIESQCPETVRIVRRALRSIT